MSISISRTEFVQSLVPNAAVLDQALTVNQLSLMFGCQQILEDISLTISTGQIHAIVGPSGCGKSSFLSCINRLAELNADCTISGELCINGEDIYSDRVNVLALRRLVGMVFQRPCPFPMSIYENLAFPLREHGIKDHQEIDQRVEQTLQLAGLWSEVKDRLQQSALRLSGGQQQRLCIARTLILEPAILLLDEPCSALDPIATGVIEDLIKDLRHRYTCLVVTHNLAQAQRIADQVSVFWLVDGAGSVIETGSTTQIFNAPKHPLTADYVQGRKG